MKYVCCNAKNTIKTVRSRNIEKNHLVIIADVEDPNHAKTIVDEIRKAIRKGNSFSKNRTSYELVVRGIRNI